MIIHGDHPGQTSTSSSQPWRWTALGGTTSHTPANGQVHIVYHDGSGNVICGLGGDDHSVGVGQHLLQQLLEVLAVMVRFG